MMPLKYFSNIQEGRLYVFHQSQKAYGCQLQPEVQFQIPGYRTGSRVPTVTVKRGFYKQLSLINIHVLCILVTHLRLMPHRTLTSLYITLMLATNAGYNMGPNRIHLQFYADTGKQR